MIQRSNFAELKYIIDQLPDIDETLVSRFWQHDSKLIKPVKSLGRIEELGAWFTGFCGTYPPKINHPRISIYTANHGFALREYSIIPSEIAAIIEKRIINCQHGGAAINQLARLMNADLKIHVMALEQPSADFCFQPALTESECTNAIAYGMMDVDEKIDILCLGEMGIGHVTSSIALCCALYGGKPQDWIDTDNINVKEDNNKKVAIVEQAIAQHQDVIFRGDGLEILACFGGRELASIVGAIIAARKGNIPVIIDGYACSAAAAILTKLRSNALDHCQIGHLSYDTGHIKLIQNLNKKPLLQLDIALDEAVGAALALGLVKASISCHTHMSTSIEAEMYQKQSSQFI